MGSAARRENAAHGGPHALAWMRAVHGRDSLDGRYRAENYRGDDFVPAFGARKPGHRPRRGRLDGDQEARGLFLMSVAANAEAFGFESFMERNLEKDLLRFTTAGSVDDGKSTLIGRLLHDSKSVFEDHMAAVKKSRINRSTGAVDFSLLTDGLRAEREQGITIDVAYRYFETPRRKFIIADTPGHEQYTRNMATGASTANLAVILIDSTKGVLAQTRRHTYIASLLGIPNVLVAINKMDLVDYSEEVFLRLQKDFDALAKQLAVPHVVTIPISALAGDNVVEPGANMPWYHGPTFLEHLETVPIRMETPSDAVRFPVQYVIRPDARFRGFAGPVASGVIRPGDPVVSLPSERKSRVKSIVTFDGDAPEAFPPMSVTLTLEDEIDLSRGDMLVSPAHPARFAALRCHGGVVQCRARRAGEKLSAQ